MSHNSRHFGRAAQALTCLIFPEGIVDRACLQPGQTFTMVHRQRVGDFSLVN
jgi:hypothetical protein